MKKYYDYGDNSFFVKKNHEDEKKTWTTNISIFYGLKKNSLELEGIFIRRMELSCGKSYMKMVLGKINVCESEKKNKYFEMWWKSADDVKFE